MILFRKAARSNCSNTFDWLNEEVQRSVAAKCHGYSPNEVKRLARAWVRDGKEILPKLEDDEEYQHRHEYWYQIVIKPLRGYPTGLFVKMDLAEPHDEDEPVVNLLGAHASGV